MALDKYYGTPEHFKAFVDSCHGRGIAVIIDIVLIMLLDRAPYCIYIGMQHIIDPQPTTRGSMQFVRIPYCWGYDYNHESQATKNFMDRVNHYWLDEYHVDGFRFDFTKGFATTAIIMITEEFNC